MLSAEKVGNIELYTKALNLSAKQTIQTLTEDSELVQNFPVKVLRDFLKNHYLVRNLSTLNLIVHTLKKWADVDDSRYDCVVTILTTFEVAALLHHYPEMASRLGYPKNLDLKCLFEDNSDKYLICGYTIEPRDVSFAF